MKHASHFNYVEILSSRQLWNKYELIPMDFPFIPRKGLGMTVKTLNFKKSSLVHFDQFLFSFDNCLNIHELIG